VATLKKDPFLAVSLIVVDGVTYSDLTNVWKRLLINMEQNLKSLEKLIISTSMQTSKGIRSLRPNVLRFCSSWTRDAYEELCENDEFFSRVAVNLGAKEGKVIFTNDEKRQLIESKFFFAGQNARWFFDYPVAEVIADIQRSLKEVFNKEDLLKGIIGDANSEAVNSLLCRSGEKEIPTITSEYIVRQLVRDIDDQALRNLLRFAHTPDGRKNPALDGWLLELDVLSAVRNGTFQSRTNKCDFGDGIKFLLGHALYEYNSSSDQFVDFFRDYPEEAKIKKFIVSWYLMNHLKDEEIMKILSNVTDREKIFKKFMKSDRTVNDRQAVNVFLEYVHPHFDSVFDNIPLQDRLAALNGSWFIPEVFNQGGYDCCQFCVGIDPVTKVPSSILLFKQITRNIHHELKVYYMTIFLNEFNEILGRVLGSKCPPVTRMQIAFVVPHDKVEGMPASTSWNKVGEPRKSLSRGAKILKIEENKRGKVQDELQVAYSLYGFKRLN
jgi:hypothetical protein